MIRRILFLAVGSLLLSSCASVPMASKDDDARARSYKVKSNESAVYLYRNEAMGAAVSVGIRLDGKRIAQTAPGVYFLWKVAPGKHTFSCESETTRDLEINVPAGKAIYIWQEMKMGFITARCQLHEVPEDEAQADMKNCRLAL